MSKKVVLPLRRRKLPNVTRRYFRARPVTYSQSEVFVLTPELYILQRTVVRCTICDVYCKYSIQRSKKVALTMLYLCVHLNLVITVEDCLKRQEGVFVTLRYPMKDDRSPTTKENCSSFLTWALNILEIEFTSSF